MLFKPFPKLNSNLFRQIAVTIKADISQSIFLQIISHIFRVSEHLKNPKRRLNNLPFLYEKGFTSQKPSKISAFILVSFFLSVGII